MTKIAIEKTGAVIVNLNIHEKKDMLECLLHRADVKAVILKQGIKNREHMDMFYQISPELKEAVPGRIYAPRLPLLRHVIVTDQERPRSCAWQFEKLMELGMSMGDSLLKERMKAVRPFDDATIIHTSGTSGVPKGVMLNHCQILENAWIHVQYLGLEKEDRLCMTPPMFHSFGCVGSVLSSMMAGAALVCYEKSGQNLPLEMLRKERCTVLCSVPTVYIRLIREMREGKAGREDLCLRLCVTAGAPCPEHTLRDMKRVMGAEAAVVMYGHDRGGTGNQQHLAWTTVWKQRSPPWEGLWPGVTGRIQDLTTGRVLGPGRAGELCIKSYGVMKGYYNNPEETEKAVDREGWLHTGDIASLSEDGLLTLKGRCKDLIIRGGENISPREIEDFIRNYEPVEDVAVVGAPDEQYGELVYAFIRPKEGAVVTKEGLRNWCRGKIATIKIPQEIELTDHFPISATGKISKGQLRSLAREHLEERGTRQTEPETGRGRTAADGNGRTAAGGNGIRRTAAVR
ncbi:MAG: AMP-binding protein [Enterocloster sp.]